MVKKIIRIPFVDRSLKIEESMWSGVRTWEITYHMGYLGLITLEARFRRYRREAS